MIVDTRNGWPGETNIGAPTWIDHVDWKNSNGAVNPSRQVIISGVEFNAYELDRNYKK